MYVFHICQTSGKFCHITIIAGQELEETIRKHFSNTPHTDNILITYWYTEKNIQLQKVYEYTIAKKAKDYYYNFFDKLYGNRRTINYIGKNI